MGEVIGSKSVGDIFSGRLEAWWVAGGEEGVFILVAYCVFVVRYDIFVFLVFIRNYFKFDGCVIYFMVFLRENKDNR